MMTIHTTRVDACVQVGHGNRRFFLLFLVHLIVCCTYGAIFMGPVVLDPEFRARRLEGQASSMLNFSFVECIIMGLVVGTFGVWHIFLGVTGQTTLECQINRKRRNFDKVSL